MFDYCDPPWTVALQAALSMEFSRQEHWSGLPCPPPGDLPDPSLPVSPAPQVDPSLAEPRGKPNPSKMKKAALHVNSQSVYVYCPGSAKIDG